MVSEFIFLHHFQSKVSEALTVFGGAKSDNPKI
jgi:hypothetical protein